MPMELDSAARRLGQRPVRRIAARFVFRKSTLSSCNWFVAEPVVCGAKMNVVWVVIGSGGFAPADPLTASLGGTPRSPLRSAGSLRSVAGSRPRVGGSGLPL